MTLKILTANRLRDGVVVYWQKQSGWVSSIAAATVASEEAAWADLETSGERAVASGEVVGPYLIEVLNGTEALRPLSVRESIRARGPSIGAEVGPQRPRRETRDEGAIHVSL